jgi:hypothetical protein
MDYLISSQEMQHDRDAMNEGEVSTSNLRTMYDLARMAKNYCDVEGQESLNELLKIIKWYMDQAEQGVTEGVAETMPINDAVKVLRHYGADHFKTTSNELHFYKNGRPLSVDLIMNDDATRSVNLSQLNAATRSLKSQFAAEALNLDDLRKAAASSRSPEDKAALKRNPNFGKIMQKSVDKHNKAIVKTKKDIGSRVADIGPGGKEYNVKTDAAWDAANKSVEEGWKSKLGAAALAGAAALGGSSAQAQSAPSGYDNLPSIVAHVTFRVGDNTVTKDINLGTEYQTPGRASAALENFLKSKGIKFFNYTLQRAPAQPPLVSKDEMDASNQEYQRQHDSNNLSNTPYSATGDEPARLQTDKGYTSSSRSGASIAYESKKAIKNKKA